jgi:hypothetical protein
MPTQVINTMNFADAVREFAPTKMIHLLVNSTWAKNFFIVKVVYWGSYIIDHNLEFTTTASDCKKIIDEIVEHVVVDIPDDEIIQYLLPDIENILLARSEVWCQDTMQEVGSGMDVARRYLDDMNTLTNFEECYPLYKRDMITHQDLTDICKLYLNYGWQVCKSEKWTTMIKDKQKQSLLQRFFGLPVLYVN